MKAIAPGDRFFKWTSVDFLLFIYDTWCGSKDTRDTVVPCTAVGSHCVQRIDNFNSKFYFGSCRVQGFFPHRPKVQRVRQEKKNERSMRTSTTHPVPLAILALAHSGFALVSAKRWSLWLQSSRKISKVPTYVHAPCRRALRCCKGVQSLTNTSMDLPEQRIRSLVVRFSGLFKSVV
jgi:hypothetical protein